ncbi:MAG: hypothetical protein ACTHJ8_14335 [Mucilaginibacter sp.]
MENTYQLFDFVSIRGNVIRQTVGQEGNMYQWLVTQGFGRAVIDGKDVTFRRTDAEVKPAAFWQMRDIFLDYLEKQGSHDLLNWFLSKSPMKQNNLYRHYLKSELTEQEIHVYKMQTDVVYRHRYQINQVLVMLSANSFKQVKDEKGTVGQGQMLYYRQTAEKQFLLFSHHNPGHKSLDGFDCWLGSFRDEKQIGQIQTDNLEDIRLSFNMDRDYELIAPYLTNYVS